MLDDRYCECGRAWTKVFNTAMYSDCYVCLHCDKIFVPSVVEVTQEEFDAQFSCDRAAELKRFARIVEARKKVTKDDLVKLGYTK